MLIYGSRGVGGRGLCLFWLVFFFFSWVFVLFCFLLFFGGYVFLGGGRGGGGFNVVVVVVLLSFVLFLVVFFLNGEGGGGVVGVCCFLVGVFRLFVFFVFVFVFVLFCYCFFVVVVVIFFFFFFFFFFWGGGVWACLLVLSTTFSIILNCMTMHFWKLSTLLRTVQLTKTYPLSDKYSDVWISLYHCRWGIFKKAESERWRLDGRYMYLPRLWIKKIRKTNISRPNKIILNWSDSCKLSKTLFDNRSAFEQKIQVWKVLMKETLLLVITGHG